ncbi:MAG: DUF3788 domain-containing protein [Acidobacteriota bacterium]
MEESIFNNKLVEPDDKMVTKELGETKEYLNRICEFIENEYNDLRPEWKFYGKKCGWVLKLFNNERNVLFIVPCTGHFRIALTFGDKAVNSVMISKLPDRIKKEFITARKYIEGRTVQIDIRSEVDLENILQLIKIKLN